MRKPGSAYKDSPGGSKCLQDEARGQRQHLGEGREKYQGKRCRDIERKRARGRKGMRVGSGSWDRDVLHTRGWHAKASDRGGAEGSERDSEKGDRESVTNAENTGNTRRRE